MTPVFGLTVIACVGSASQMSTQSSLATKFPLPTAIALSVTHGSGHSFVLRPRARSGSGLLHVRIEIIKAELDIAHAHVRRARGRETGDDRGCANPARKQRSASHPGRERLHVRRPLQSRSPTSPTCPAALADVPKPLAASVPTFTSHSDVARGRLQAARLGSRTPASRSAGLADARKPLGRSLQTSTSQTRVPQWYKNHRTPGLISMWKWSAWAAL